MTTRTWKVIVTTKEGIIVSPELTIVTGQYNYITGDDFKVVVEEVKVEE